MNLDISRASVPMAVADGRRRVFDAGLVAVFHDVVERGDHEVLFPVKEPRNPQIDARHPGLLYRFVHIT